MAGIVAVGSYIPYYRMSKKGIFEAWGWFNSAGAKNSKGEISFANYDEDSITMSVEAAFECLNAVDRVSIGSLFFSTTTAPYIESSNASIIAEATDLEENILTEDVTHTLRSSSLAFISALNYVKTNPLKRSIVCAADKRVAKPADNLEFLFGHAGVAFVVGNDSTIADVENIYTSTAPLFEYRRTEMDRYVKSWEERWIRDEGLIPVICEHIKSFLDKFGYKISDFDKVIYPCPDNRVYLTIAKKLNLSKDQIEDALIDNVGYTGTPHAFLMLLSALEKLRPGNKILLANYGNGVDIISFVVTGRLLDRSEYISLDRKMETKKSIENYVKFASLTEKIDMEVGARGEVAKSALSVMWRERKTILVCTVQNVEFAVQRCIHLSIYALIQTVER